MDINGYGEQISSRQLLGDDDLEELKASFEKAIKEAKESLEKTENLVLQLAGAKGSLKIRDTNTQQSSTASFRHATMNAEENTTLNNASIQEVRASKPRISLKKYMEDADTQQPSTPSFPHASMNAEENTTVNNASLEEVRASKPRIYLSKYLKEK